LLIGYTTSYGVGGSSDFMLVIQPSDGTGTAGAHATPTEGTHSLTEAGQTITETAPTLTEGDVTLADADQTVTTTVVFATTHCSDTCSPGATQCQTTTTRQTCVGGCPGMPV
jgi:heterodisulfide reductase subunit A-like polyferredoxin